MKIKGSVTETLVKDSKFENYLNWITLGVDIEARRIYFDMDVDPTMEVIIGRSLIKMAEISKDPIDITMSTYGGEMYSALAIYDAIRACKCEVRVHATGKIMSAGLIIFLAADIRTASKHVTFMAHSVSSGTEGKLKDQKVDIAEADRINNLMLDILAERTKKPRKLWYRYTLSHDKYFDLTEATALGLVNNAKAAAAKKVRGRK